MTDMGPVLRQWTVTEHGIARVDPSISEITINWSGEAAARRCVVTFLLDGEVTARAVLDPDLARHISTLIAEPA